MFKRMPIPFGYVLVTGVVLGVVLGFKSFIPYMYWGDTAEYEWYRSALPHVINYLFWPFLVPFIYWAFERFRIGKGAIFKDRAGNIGMSLLIPLMHEVATTIIYFVLLSALDVYAFNDKTWAVVLGAFPSVYIGRIVEYWIIYGLFAAFDYYKKYKNKQAEIGRMEAKLNRTKLAVLKMQLQPHFLFNALNSISSLMEVDVKKAQTITARLGELLRGILEQDERLFIQLEEDLNYVKTYLEIEKIRFEDRLEVIYEIDEGALGCAVPMLLIQPLAENAIKHGIAKMASDGIIRIEVRVENNRLKIIVEDNGPETDVETSKMLGKGIGLANIKSRLNQHFGDDFVLSILPDSGHGFRIEIEIPKTNYHEKYSSDNRR
jgi:two-component system, LytTR family, sensor kinase